MAVVHSTHESKGRSVTATLERVISIVVGWISAVWNKLRPGKLLVGLIRVYQRVLSPLSKPTCRFVPSCSEYAAQSIEKHGATKGCLRALRRLVKCHPFHEGGYDPP